MSNPVYLSWRARQLKNRIKPQTTVLALVGVSVGFVIGVLFVGVLQ